ncbi:MAG: trypsin-like peptidase domain-containing protein [Paracoccaceae bacterium]
MKSIFGCFVTVSAVMTATTLYAQQPQVWVQVEAVPTLREAQDRARDYGRDFANITAFATDTGWYALALGPFDDTEASETASRLRRLGLIPRDSYVSDGGSYGRRVWPAGIAAAGTDGGAEPSANVATAEPAPVVDEPVPDESRAEARRSEALLEADARHELQSALKWEGFYDAKIDGSFGPGTRNAMAAWQNAAGVDVTGILTTRQRATLLEGYRKAQATVGLAPVLDAKAGIAIDLPLAMVEFDRYEAPFAHFRAKDGSGVQVLLISQRGDQATLFGLYDIMQTLEIVPLNGPRERNASSFTLAGEDDELLSFTHARLSDGFVKGYTLLWPAAEDRRMQQHVLDQMAATFVPDTENALDASLSPPSAEDRAGLLAGLEVRRPEISRSGFYVDAIGSVLTTAAVLQDCGRITLDGVHEAELALSDAALGLAVLKPLAPLAPAAHARFQTTQPRLAAEVAVAGYSYEDALDAPVLTFGTLADTRGLQGEKTLARLDMTTLPGDVGGAVFDTSGSVIGVLAQQPSGDRVLPEEVSFAVRADAVLPLLDRAGIKAEPVASGQGTLAAEDLTRLGMDIAVKVSCWR